MYMKYINEYLDALVGLMNEMSPYLLLGFIFAGILHIFFPSEKISRFLGRNNTASVMNASLLGIPLPLCSCGVIPTGVSFHKSGASKGSSISFLISSPQTGVDSILITYSLLGLPFALIRPVVALITGIFGGSLVNVFDKKVQHIKQARVATKTSDYSHLSWYRKIYELFRYTFGEFLQDIAKWLVIGLLLAALITVLVPDDFFNQYIENDFLGMLILLAASIPLYVCATASVPIAAALMMKGLSAGAALVFLMAGPATNIATMTVLGKVFGRKTLLTYLFAIISGALIFGLLINELLPASWFIIPEPGMHGGHDSHLLPYWLMVSSSIILGIFLIKGLIREFFPSLFTAKKGIQTDKSANQNLSNMTYQLFRVEGMTCSHCKANIEKSISNLEGVQNAEADLASSEVKVEGDSVDSEIIRETVEGIGYKYGGEIVSNK
jgi:uncharacterized protein